MQIVRALIFLIDFKLTWRAKSLSGHSSFSCFMLPAALASVILSTRAFVVGQAMPPLKPTQCQIDYRPTCWCIFINCTSIMRPTCRKRLYEHGYLINTFKSWASAPGPRWGFPPNAPYWISKDVTASSTVLDTTYPFL